MIHHPIPPRGVHGVLVGGFSFPEDPKIFGQNWRESNHFPLVQGRASGEGLFYFESWPLQWRISYSNSQMHGLAREYDEKGAMRCEVPYLRGKITRALVRLGPEGRTQGLTYYTNGKREGRETLFGENQTIKEETDFQNDLPHGQKREYRDEGTLQTLWTYQKGKAEGLKVWFYPNGKTNGIFPYHKGLQDGVSRVFFPDGSVSIQIPWVRGLKEGPEIWFQTIGF